MSTKLCGRFFCRRLCAGDAYHFRSFNFRSYGSLNVNKLPICYPEFQLSTTIRRLTLGALRQATGGKGNNMLSILIETLTEVKRCQREKQEKHWA